MSQLELLTIPGLDGSGSLKALRMKSRKRMQEGVKTRRLAAAVISATARRKGR